MRYIAAVLASILCGCGGAEPEAAAAPDAGRDRIRNFWTLYRQASQLRLEEKHAEAARAYREALTLNATHEDSLYYLAASLERTGDYREAVAALETLLDVNPASSRAAAQLGYLLSTPAPGAVIDFERAERLFDRLKEINKEQAGPFLQLGHLRLNQGRLAEAAEDFRIASRFGAPEGHFWLGYSLYLQGRGDEAAEPLRKVLAAWEHERKLANAGVRSEGDVRPSAKPVTALERSGVKARYLLAWMDASPAPAGPFRALPGNVRPKGPAAAADFDAGGLPDLLVAGPGPVTLYHNLGGGRFADVTVAAGLGAARNMSDAVWADVDRDSRPDLYLTGDRNMLFRNLGGGRFADITESSGLAGQRPTSRALFVPVPGRAPDLVEVGPASIRLYRNTGARWVDHTARAGLDAAGAVVDISVCDVNADGHADLFALRWRKPASLYLNRGDGTYVDASSGAGLAAIHGDYTSSVFFDYDGDRRPDLFIAAWAAFQDVASQANHAAPKPRLFRNAGHGTFSEVTASGLDRAYGSMQALAADFDADGWTDVLLINGSADGERLERSVILRNTNGAGFEEWALLPPFAGAANSTSAAFADFTGDGRPDIYLAPNPLVARPGRPAALWLIADR
ncbi:MAG: VCBS repeat-containing protein [Bryobacteraceae bacterium]|nr:VCBS repeat-containing protein [Bryobacteraceae bacterium]